MCGLVDHHLPAAESLTCAVSGVRKLTTALAREHVTVVVEDLNVAAIARQLRTEIAGLVDALLTHACGVSELGHGR